MVELKRAAFAGTEAYIRFPRGPTTDTEEITS